MNPYSLPVVVLLMLLFTFAIYFTECFGFLAFAGWYFRMGPVLHREEWQTSVSPASAIDVLDTACKSSAVPMRRRDELFCFRRRALHFGAWPRATLRVIEGRAGAVIVYEVKPFVSMALLGILIVVVILPIRFQWFWLITAVFMAGVYAAYWPRELKQLGRLAEVRALLGGIGVRICDDCGYDLFAADGQVCPECGRPVEALRLPEARPAGVKASPPV